MVKTGFVKQGGAHLTKPGWSKPHTHSNPTNLALFRHKITLYRFNQGGGGAHTIAGGLSPPNPLTLTTVNGLGAGLVSDGLRALVSVSESKVSVLVSVSEKKKNNILTTTMQYALAKENHITVVVGCRKGQHHQCRPPMT